MPPLRRLSAQNESKSELNGIFPQHGNINTMAWKCQYHGTGASIPRRGSDHITAREQPYHGSGAAISPLKRRKSRKKRTTYSDSFVPLPRNHNPTTHVSVSIQSGQRHGHGQQQRVLSRSGLSLENGIRPGMSAGMAGSAGRKPDSSDAKGNSPSMDKLAGFGSRCGMDYPGRGHTCLPRDTPLGMEHGFGQQTEANECRGITAAGRHAAGPHTTTVLTSAGRGTAQRHGRNGRNLRHLTGMRLFGRN